MENNSFHKAPEGIKSVQVIDNDLNCSKSIADYIKTQNLI